MPRYDGSRLGWDRKRQLNISYPLTTEQTTQYASEADDGYYEKGIARSYEVLSTGQYSGTSNIVINSKTCALENACVLDKRTELTWAQRVIDSDVGPAGDGKLFWQQWTLAAEDCTFDSAGKTITADSGTPFDTGALCAGRIFVVSGTASNNGTFTVASISTSVITVSEAVSDEASIATTFATTNDLIWDAVDQANTNTLGGHADWRVPNINELATLLDYGTSLPFIDQTTFPSTPSSTYWTSTTFPGSTTYAHTVNFNNMIQTYSLKKTTKTYFRLVRGGVT